MIEHESLPPSVETIDDAKAWYIKYSGNLFGISRDYPWIEDQIRRLGLSQELRRSWDQESDNIVYSRIQELAEELSHHSEASDEQIDEFVRGLSGCLYILGNRGWRQHDRLSEVLDYIERHYLLFSAGQLFRLIRTFVGPANPESRNGPIVQVWNSDEDLSVRIAEVTRRLAERVEGLSTEGSVEGVISRLEQRIGQTGRPQRFD